jgi:hypothetical protein
MRRALILQILLCPWLALGQGETNLSDLMRARNYAMGGAYRAIALGGEAITGSPAALALRRRYEFELAGAFDAQTKFGYGSVAIIDSQTTDLAAGLSYHFVSLGRGDQQRSVNFATLAFAAPVSESFFIGGGVKYLIESGAVSANAVTVDAGILVRLSEGLLVSVNAQNLVDVAKKDLSRYYALGLAYVTGPLTAAADLRADFTGPSARFAYHGGLEYILGGSIPLRAGYSRDNIISTEYVSAGVGFFGKGGGIDLAYRHEIGGADGRLVALALRF